MPHRNPPPTSAVRLAGWACTIEQSALQEMLARASHPDILSFALGLPAPELFPTKEFAQASARVLARRPRCLQYGMPSEELKEHVVELMARRGVECIREQVFLTSGAQQAVNLLARILLEAGGQVLMEELAYTGFQQVLLPFHPLALTVETDADAGMDMDSLEQQLSNGARPAFIYVVPEGHNPLSVSLPSASRTRLAELARDYQVPVVEDDAYGFLYYDRLPPPPVRSLDEQWVFYVGTFSKILAPALRVGWLVVPQSLLTALSVAKESIDINTATFAQHVVAAYLDSGQLPDHLRNLRAQYRVRRDAMHRSLLEHFPGGSKWNKPNSGVFFWVELPEGMQAEQLLKVAIEEERVAFIPGQAFCVDGSRKATRCMRLNFSHCAAEQIEEGIARLGRAAKRLGDSSVPAKRQSV